MRLPKIDDLPHVLCGPIVRRTTLGKISIWLATKEACVAKVTVGQQENPTAVSSLPLGQHLHLCLLTIDGPFESDTLLPYDITFEVAEKRIDLDEATGHCQLAYFGNGPSIATPPSSLANLRIAHSSCRLVHGVAPDALIRLDDSNLAAGTRHNLRIQQLFLTGDQIYADTHRIEFLDYIAKLSRLLIGPEPIAERTDNQDVLLHKERAKLLKLHAGFIEPFSEHIITFGEYATTYLLYWSDVLWPKEELQKDLERFRQGLPKVRRLFANTPIYMQLDDHEISDDAYMTKAWSESVPIAPIGKQLIDSASAAYALFQAWGNDPAYFSELAETITSTKRFTPTKSWAYSIQFPTHLVVALDLRTTRRYSGIPHAKPLALTPINERAFANKTKLTVLVSSFPLVQMRKTWWEKTSTKIYRGFLRFWKRTSKAYTTMYGPDAGDTWDPGDLSLPKLLRVLCQENDTTIVLSGDIHLGHFGTFNYQENTSRMKLLQFTASPSTRPTRSGRAKHRIRGQKRNIDLRGLCKNAQVYSEMPPPWNGGWSEPRLRSNGVIEAHDFSDLKMPESHWSLTGEFQVGTSTDGTGRYRIGEANVGVLSVTGSVFLVEHLWNRNNQTEKTTFVTHQDID